MLCVLIIIVQIYVLIFYGKLRHFSFEIENVKLIEFIIITRMEQLVPRKTPHAINARKRGITVKPPNVSLFYTLIGYISLTRQYK